MKKKKRLKRRIKFLLLILLICVGAGVYVYYEKPELLDFNEKETNNKENKPSNSNESTDIKEIKEKYNLSYEIPKKYEDLFRKYSKVVEANNNLGNYKKEVYNLFYIFTFDSINKHLEADQFLEKLSTLTISVNTALESNGYGGMYYDYTPAVEIEKEHSNATYHELMHFVDYKINTNTYDNLKWKCDGKLVDEKTLKKEGKNINKCEYLVATQTDFIKEAGAELYSGKFFKKGIVAYYDIVAYLTGIEYIIGSEKTDELFLGAGGDLHFMYLIRGLDYSEDDYMDIVSDLNYYTYPETYTYVTPTGGKAVDALIDLYKANMKSDWTSDEEFKYILNQFLGTGDDSKYKNSKYKNELSKITYKSYEDFVRREKNMLDQLPKDDIFRTTPIPVFILNDELFLGTGVRKEGENTDTRFGYFKYDFKNKKVSDLKYNSVD